MLCTGLLPSRSNLLNVYVVHITGMCETIVNLCSSKLLDEISTSLHAWKIGYQPAPDLAVIESIIHVVMVVMDLVFSDIDLLCTCTCLIMYTVSSVCFQ